MSVSATVILGLMGTTFFVLLYWRLGRIHRRLQKLRDDLHDLGE